MSSHPEDTQNPDLEKGPSNSQKPAPTHAATPTTTRGYVPQTRPQYDEVDDEDPTPPPPPPSTLKRFWKDYPTHGIVVGKTDANRRTDIDNAQGNTTYIQRNKYCGYAIVLVILIALLILGMVLPGR
ncbi:uncharacterized protein BJX67DRAFT_384745 [Aspergillus lucknowensis]|uniref:Uncharacterized protein n=1 Tax=Aspergillus lucknowensis TaxID=176173 RepID=A0ABR4LJ32_9EURO